MPDIKLSPHFTLHELTASQTATRKNIEEQFAPPPEILAALKFLCVNLLEKLRTINNDNFLIVSSGYRCARLNRMVGGVKSSQHQKGEAVDIDFGSIKANKEFFNKVKSSGIEFDQLLNEFNFAWIHISFAKTGNRKQIINIT